MAGKTIERDAKGIPLKSPIPDGMPVAAFYGVMNVIFGALGYAIAWFWAYSASKRDDANTKIQMIVTYDLGWFYLGIFLLKILQLPLYIMLGETRSASRIPLPDQHVYKVMGAEGSKLGYVLMDTEGVNGNFNRAQRALQNYHESFPSVLMLYLAATWVFPYESFVCAMIWAVSRIMSASGYKTEVDGRMGGMVLGTVALCVLQGMIMMVFIKTLM